MLPVDCRMQSVISVLGNSIYADKLSCHAYSKFHFDYNRKGKTFSTEHRHPIIDLSRYGFKISKRTYGEADQDSFINELKNVEGVVIRHSYSSLLKRMKLIKVRLPVDISHMIYSNEVNISNGNLIIQTTDAKFKKMTWSHFFSEEDEKVTAYFIDEKPKECIGYNQLLAMFEASIADCHDMYSAEILSAISHDIREDILIKKSEIDVSLWNRNIWKLYITRGWFSEFANHVLKDKILQEQMLSLSLSYLNISKEINQKVIKEKNHDVSEQIDKLMENIYAEYAIIKKIRNER